MPLGYIDALTTAGLVEGWAYDQTRPLDPLRVSVTTAQRVEIAAGYAHLFRHDLAVAGHAYGWCHFRLALERPVESVRTLSLRLVEAETGAPIYACEGLRVRDEAPYEIRDLDPLLRGDPTVLQSLEQLLGFVDLFNAFVAAQGVEAFLRAAYVYVLGRAIDPTGLALYTRLIANKRLSPYDVLLALADSQEFASKARALAAPGRAGFLFRAA